MIKRLILILALAIPLLSNSQAEFQDNVRPLYELNEEGISEAYPWISPDGLTLFYTKGTWGNTAIYKATRANVTSVFGTPVVCSEFPSGSYSLWLSNDLSYGAYCRVVFNSGVPTYNVYFVNLIGGQYTSRIVYLRLNSQVTNVSFFVSSPSINSAQNVMYLFLDDGKKGELISYNNLYFYSTAVDTDKKYSNSTFVTSPLSGQLSKDQSIFDFSYNESGASFSSIGALGISGSVRPFTLQPIPRAGTINSDELTLNIHPTTTLNRQQLVFAKNRTNDWNANDLYIATNTTLSQNFRESDLLAEKSLEGLVSDLDVAQIGTVYFPNPAKDGFTIKIAGTSNTSQFLFKMYDLLGNMIISQTTSQSSFYVETSNVPNGIYQTVLEINGQILSKKIAITK